MHVQDLGGARHVSLCVLEAARDVTALEFSAIFAEIGCKWNPQAVKLSLALDHAALRHARGDLIRQIFRRDFITLGHYYRAIDGVLQLAHISRPVVFDQPF